jgi:kumamolisin
VYNKLSRAVSIAVFFVAAFVFSFAAVSGAHAQTVLTHHLYAPLVGSKALQPVGKLPASQVLTLDVVLPLRDPMGLDIFLSELYDPSSPQFHQFITPSDFAVRFGPTQSDYQTVVSFLKANGFNVYGGTYLGHEIQVKAPVSVIESAFHVSMNVYQHPTENRTFYSPDREPTTNLPFPLWHISGLDNYSIPHPQVVKREDAAKKLGVSPESLTPNATTGSGPSASFLGSDMRAAYYTAGGGTLTGAGQNAGLLEYAGTNLADLKTYYTNVKQTLPITPILLSTDGTPTACNYTNKGGYCDDTEQNLDMTQILGMAPGLASLTVYIGSTDTAMISAMTTNNPLPVTIGCSWGWTPVDPAILDPYFQQMSAQGQNFFVAAGDSGNWTSSNFAWPADDAYVVTVGGTDLVTASAAGPWKSETAWSGYGGGGVSPDGIAIPSWQQLVGVINTKNNGSTTLRNGPDVSANANFTFYTCEDQSGCLANSYGGTSFAAPMWAGYMALVDQGMAATKYPAPIGFINPTIYADNVVAATYAANFHDITSGSTGNYAAVAGYDLVTGWGSPTTALAASLIGSTVTSRSPDFTITPSSPTLTVTTTSTLTDSINLASLNGLTGSVSLSCTPTGGLTCSLSPTSTIFASGVASSTLTIITSGATVAGTYTVTVTGSSTISNTTHSTVISVTTPADDFTIAAAPATFPGVTSGNILQPYISLTSVNGFTGPVTVSCSAPTGITCYFGSPTTPTSTQTLTSWQSGSPFQITINTAALTSINTFTVTVTGTGAGTGPKPDVHSTPITINVTSLLPPAFAIVPATNTLTIASIGGSATDALTLNADATFSGLVNLVCGVTAYPVAAVNDVPTCSVSPSSATVPAGGSVTGPVVTIGTTAAHFKSGGLHSSVETKRIEWLAGGLFLALLVFPLRRRRMPLLAVVLTVLMLTGSLIGCVNYNQPATIKSTDPGTSLGAYTITVVGTPANSSSSPVEEANITLTVQ